MIIALHLHLKVHAKVDSRHPFFASSCRADGSHRGYATFLMHHRSIIAAVVIIDAMLSR